MRKAPLSRPRLLLLISVSAVLGVGGLARAQSTQPAPVSAVVVAAEITPDPFEKLNRKFFALNAVLDRTVIRPVAVFYHRAAPGPLRAAVNNFTTNLSEPLVFINDVLQGRPAAAAAAATRFAANTLIGLGGIVDVTGATGLPHHDNGFGLTLGRWGVKTGPYLYFPVVGPSTLRDTAGSVVDIGLSPLTYASTFLDNGLGTGLGIASGLDTRAAADSDLAALKALSTDEYAALRSFYLQNRQAQITGGKIDLNALPDFDDPATPPAAVTVGAVRTSAAAGSIVPSVSALEAPPAAVPGVPVGGATALPSPGAPADAATVATPPADLKGV